MADDSSEIPECDFNRASDSPRNTDYYDLPILTKEQQEHLNSFKRKINVEDEQYLANNPEVRGCIALGLRNILHIRPRTNVVETFARFYAKSKVDLEEDVKTYIAQRKVIGHEDTTCVYIPEGKRVTQVYQDNSTISSELQKIIYDTLSEHLSPEEKDVKIILSDILFNALIDITSDSISIESAADTIKKIVENFRARTLSNVGTNIVEAVRSVQRTQEEIDEKASVKEIKEETSNEKIIMDIVYSLVNLATSLVDK